MTVAGTPTDNLKLADMQAAANAIAARTTDPGLANAGFDSWWNNSGVVTISTGYTPSLDFSKYQNSMYIGAIT